MEKFNKDELSLIAHALGVKIFESAMSHKKKDKQLPNEFYRNHHASRNGNAYFEVLVINGYATKRIVLDDICYHVTEKGIKKFRSEFYEIVNYQPVRKRDLNYLKQRLNFYSKWYGYNFGEDNAQHIISAFINYFLKGFYMSHTTKDCVKRFKNELRAAYKKGLIIN